MGERLRSGYSRSVIPWMLLAVAYAAPWADAPSPARLCADAASGSEVEVCLRLAATHPDAVDGIAAALRARLDRASSSDRELLLAILALVDGSPEAAGRLGELGDPRAVPPLVFVAESGDPAHAREAVRALPTWSDAIRPLSRWLLDRELGLAVRLEAVDALGALGTDLAADVLVDALRRPRIPPVLRERMAQTLAARWPDRAPRTLRHPTADGTPWLAAGSAWSLGAALATAGHLGQARLTALGAATGAAAGGTAGYLFGRAWPSEAGDAALVTTSSMLGTGGGALIGLGLGGDPDLPWWLGLGGTAGGYGLAYGLRRVHPGTAGDAVEGAALSLLIGAAAGSGAALLDQQPALAAGVGVLAGGVVGHALSPRVDLTARDLPLLVAASAYGAGVGWVAAPDRPEAALGGGAVGAVVGYGLAGLGDAPPDVLVGSAVGAAYGGLAGAGLGQLLEREALPTLAGGALGLGLGAALAHHDPEPIDDRDVVLVGAATGWAAWQVAGWTVASGRDLREPIGGLARLGPALIGAGTVLVANQVDVPVTHTAAAVSLGLWGGWFGGLAGQVGPSLEPRLPAALIASNLALLGGSVAVSPAVGLPPLVVGLADAGGVLGGSLAAVGTSLVTGDGRAIRLASLVGSGAGLATGAVVGTLWRRSGNTRDVALWRPGPLQISVTPAFDARGANGLTVVVHGW